MKNLWLFVILIVLVVFTYYFDELEDIKQRFEHQRKTQLFELSRIGELKGIKTSTTEFFKMGDLYYTGKNHRLVDSKKMNRFMEILSSLRVSRVLTSKDSSIGKREDYFSEESNKFEFIFSGGTIKYMIGKKLDFAKSFYVEIEKNGQKKWVVAYDSSPETGVYQQDNFHRSDQKYQRLVRMSLLKEDFFYDRYVFRGKKKIGGSHFFAHADVKSKRNRNYELNFTDNYVTPACPQGIVTDSKMFEDVSHALLNMKGTQLYYPYRKALLKEWKGTIKIRDFDDNVHRLDIFAKYGSLSGYFVRANLNENLYELDHNSAQIFFIHHQEYCNLRLPFGEISKVKKEVLFDIDFKNGDYFKLYIPWKDKFQVEFLDDEKSLWIPNNSSFHSLFQFVNKKADMITLVKKNAKKLISDATFSLQYQGDTFYIIYKDKEIQLMSLKHKYLLHYLVGENVPIGININDYFLKKRNE